jgi:hypothetical protein
MLHWMAIPQRWRYTLAIVISFSFSLGGIVWCFEANRPQDSGRGGAIGTAIAFAILFLRPDWGIQLMEKRLKAIPPDLSLEARCAAETRAVIEGLRINSTGQLRQNKALALASVVGTLISGIGDWIVTWLIHLRAGY